MLERALTARAVSTTQATVNICASNACRRNAPAVRWRLAVLTVLAMATGALVPALSTARAQCTVPVEIATLVASDGETQDGFGCAVAVSANTIAVGARYEGGAFGANPERGAVYIFTRSGNTWVQQQKILPSDSTGGQLFGTSVVLSGSTLLVGAPGASGGGAAYVFTLSGSTWVQTIKLVASDRTANDGFGVSVALSNTANRRIALIGAFGETNTGPTGTTGGIETGSAYVFTLNTLTPGAVWTQQQKLMPTDGGPGDEFGYSVALSGTTAIIGAPQDSNIGGSRAGSAYVFAGNITGSTWTQQTKLTADDPTPGDLFGTAVSCNSGTAAVGAPFWEPGPNPGSLGSGDGGAVYMFTVSDSVWTQAQRISESFTGFHFGSSVALLGDRMVGGRPGPLATNFVRPQLYTRTDGLWQGGQSFWTDVDGRDENLGCSVALSSTLAVFGADEDSILGAGSGSVRVFDLVVQDTPFFEQQPQSTQAAVGGSTSFTVALAPSNNTQTSYGWQYELTPGSDIWASLVAGPNPQGIVPMTTNSPTLTLTGLTSDAFVRYRARVLNSCGIFTYSNPATLTELVTCPADLGSAGGLPSPDGTLDNNDFIVFINYFFDSDPRADLGSSGGISGSDNAWDNNDFIAFIDHFFDGCG